MALASSLNHNGKFTLLSGSRPAPHPTLSWRGLNVTSEWPILASRAPQPEWTQCYPELLDMVAGIKTEQAESDFLYSKGGSYYFRNNLCSHILIPMTALILQRTKFLVQDINVWGCNEVLAGHEKGIEYWHMLQHPWALRTYRTATLTGNAQKKQVYRNRKPGVGDGVGWVDWVGSAKGFLWQCDDNVLKLIVVMAAQFHEYTKSYSFVYFSGKIVRPVNYISVTTTKG
jgi:hypothetical protein